MSGERWNPAADLDSLRWREDTVITNHDGERVWLKPMYVDGKRVGITDCCLADEPCDSHATPQPPERARKGR